MTMDSENQTSTTSFGKGDLQNEKNLQTLTKMIDTVLFFCNDIELLNKLFPESKEKQAQTTDDKLFQSFTTPGMSGSTVDSSSVLSRKMSLQDRIRERKMQVQDSNLKNQDQEMKALRYDIEMLQ